MARKMQVIKPFSKYVSALDNLWAHFQNIQHLSYLNKMKLYLNSMTGRALGQSPTAESTKAIGTVRTASMAFLHLELRPWPDAEMLRRAVMSTNTWFALQQTECSGGKQYGIPSYRIYGGRWQHHTLHG